MWLPIFRKEFAEVFGDSRTIFNVVVGPLLFTPLLFALIGSMARNQAAESRKEQVVVAVVGAAKAPSIDAELKGRNNLGVTFTPASGTAEVERKIRERSVGAGLVIGGDAERQMQSGKPAPVTLIADMGNESSSQAADRLKDFLQQRAEKIAAQRLSAKGLTRDVIRPFDIQERPLKGSSPMMLFLAGLLPYVLSMSAIMGGLMAATNTVAGEKERG